MFTSPHLRSPAFFVGFALVLIGAGTVSNTTFVSSIDKADAQTVTQRSSSSSRFQFLREKIRLGSSSSMSSVFRAPSFSSSSSAGFVIPVLASSSSSSSSATITAINPSILLQPTLWISQSDKLAITVTPDRTEVFPGDLVTFTVRICNKTDLALQNLPVSLAYAAHEFTLVSISDAGRHTLGTPVRRTAPQRDTNQPTGVTPITMDENGVRSDQNRVDWMLATLGAHQTKLFTVTLRMDAGLRRGDVLRVDGLVHVPNEGLARALGQVRVLATMPGTGVDLSNPSAETPLINESWKQ